MKKISLRLTISEPSSKPKSNPRQLQYMNILLAKTYHDKATFETLKTVLAALLSVAAFFLLVKHARRFLCALYSVSSYKKI